MKVLVIGGTGFIGYHCVIKLLSRGHQVTVFCRNPMSASILFNDSVSLIQGDLDTFSTEDYNRTLCGFEAVYFLAGADERAKTVGPVLDFFIDKNVTSCDRLATAAINQNIKHLVVVGSMFSYLNRIKPELKIAHHHPYIASRCQQEAILFERCKDRLTLSFLELPYVFGAAPTGQPLWAPLISYIRTVNPLLVSRGGANMTSITTVSNALAGALEAGAAAHGTFQVGDENLTWVELCERIITLLDYPKRPINIMGERVFGDLTRLGGYMKDFFGAQSGLDTKHIAQLLTQEVFFDPAESQQRFNYQGGDLDQALKATIYSSNTHKSAQRWDKLVSTFNWSGKRANEQTF